MDRRDLLKMLGLSAAAFGTGQIPAALPEPRRKLLAVILDVSGSMDAVRESIVSSFNDYVDALRDEPLVVCLSKFNTTCQPYFWGVPIAELPKMTVSEYVPAGSTALYDAIAQTINDINGELRGCKVPVLCQVITDGRENDSRETTLTQAKELISNREATGHWTFAYMSSSPDLWDEAYLIGTQVGNTVHYLCSPAGVRGAMGGLGRIHRNWSQSTANATTSLYGGARDLTGEDPE